MNSLFVTHGTSAECMLCPHQCRLADGKTGICGVRRNNGGKIELLTYGIISAYSSDPVEKKPLYHFFPGKNILSAGSYGCNLKCDFCQNWQISQVSHGEFGHVTTPERIVSDAMSVQNNAGIAFTYNEPVIWYEFMRDVALLAKGKGLHTVMVSNGYVNPGPLREITGFIDAFNIDLKSFDEMKHKRLTGAKLEPVKKALSIIGESGKHLEITSLIIPGNNDDPEDMRSQARWIAAELGEETPFHISRYFPVYKRDDPPTSPETLHLLFRTASEYLRYVYLGNITGNEGNDTACSRCGTVVTKRKGYNTRQVAIDGQGRCTTCGNLIYRYFISP